MILLIIYILSSAFCIWFFRREFYEALSTKSFAKGPFVVLTAILLMPVINTALSAIILAILLYDITETARAFRRKK